MTLNGQARLGKAIAGSMFAVMAMHGAIGVARMGADR